MFADSVGLVDFSEGFWGIEWTVNLFGEKFWITLIFKWSVILGGYFLWAQEKSYWANQTKSLFGTLASQVVICFAFKVIPLK